MAEQDCNNNELSATASVYELIKELGGVKALRDYKAQFHQVVLRLDQERTNLLDKYPNKWVAVGRDGVLAVADSMEDVFAEVESMGLSGSEFEVEFLDSDPPDLIL